MQIRWSGSVKFIYLDRQKVKDDLKKAVARLAEARPEVQRVILFGSLARGDAVPGSDADILVVLIESDKDFLHRISDYMPSDVPISVDVFPYTEDELERMLNDGNQFVKRALSEGVLLFERATEAPAW